VKSLDVVVVRDNSGGLTAVFNCRIASGLLLLPVQKTGAADGLWRHTCCELFAGETGEAAYREFNASPSGQWAEYGFSDYRVRDSFYLPGPTPRINFAPEPGGWKLELHLDHDFGQFELGVSVVLETVSGELSYWALHHAAAQPDFHQRESFVLRQGDLGCTK
jgi:hypothetical protein